MFTHNPAQAVATKVTLLMTDGKQQNGFIQDSNAKQLLFAVNAQGKGDAINRTSVKSIRFREEAKLMARGRQAFRQSAYEAAAKIFGKVATDYAGIAALKDNFASEASFYQMECLRRLGKYEELAPILASKAGKTIASTQDKLFGEQLKLMKMWAAYSAGKWDMVKAGMKFYQVPQVGDAKMLPAPVFKKMAKPTMIQLSFLRGKMYEQEKKLGLALEDYYRAFTITYGNQPTLAKQAMLAALAIQAADPKLKDLQTNIWQLQGLAYYFKNGVGGGDIPAEYEQYAVLPDMPVRKPVEVKKEEQEKKESEDAAKTSKAVADKKAADEKKALDGKGEKKVEEKKAEEKK
ncbi:MAG: hypothetical protein L3J39_12860 [Verrucomicrobiales bacterium]|nr:hypothetical protein [Verrucomicrobiales bacterium]